MENKSSKFGKSPWEESYHPSVRKENKKEIGAAFNPMPPKERMKTYKPVNECDT